MRTSASTATRARGVPVEIEFREIHPSLAAERELHRNVQRLAKAYPELTGCRVLIEPQAAGDRRRCHVRIDLTVPRGEVEIEHSPSSPSAGHDLAAVVREAFVHARRKLIPRTRGVAILPPHRLF